MIVEKVQFIAYALITTNVDGTKETIEAYTEKEDVAEKFKLRSGWNNYRKVEVNQVYYIIESLEELDFKKQCDKRDAALAKLTEEEKHLLGLK